MKDNIPTSDSVTTDQRENQLRFIVTLVSRYWKFILLFAVGAGLASWGFGLYFAPPSRPAVHEATQELSIKQMAWDNAVQSDVAMPLPWVRSPDRFLKRIDTRKLAETLVDSPEAVLALANPSEDPELLVDRETLIARMAAALNVTPLAGTEHLMVSAWAPTSEGALDLSGHVTDALIEENHALLALEYEELRGFLGKELVALQTSLQEVEKAEWALLRKRNFRTYGEVTKDLREKNQVMLEAQVKRTQIVADLSAVEDEIRKNHDTLPLALSQITDTLIVTMLEELEALRKDELAMSLVATDEYEPLQILRDDIADQEHAVLEAVRRYEAGTGSGSNVWDERQQLRAQHTLLQLELARLDAETQGLQAHLETLFENMPTIASDSHEYNELQREIESFRKQYNLTRDREFRLRMVTRAGVGELERAAPGEVAAMAVPKTSYVMDAAIGALVGFLIAFGLAMMLDMMDTSIRSVDEIFTSLGKEVIGAIPEIRAVGQRRRGRRRMKAPPVPESEVAVDASIITLHDPKSPVSEAYRSLRTNFHLATVQDQPRTVMITSAVPGEGKTTTAVNLAVAMAGSGLRVLLMDCDLRRPNVHRLLRINRSPGLSEVLTEDLDIHSVMQTTLVENLLVVPSGHLPPNPSELLNSPKMRQMIGQLGKEFDLVLCDAPSVIVVTDPILLATQVDSIIMLVSVNNARRETILRAMALLETAKGKIAGIVANGIEPSRRRYYYYYYYYEDRVGKGKQRRRWYHD